MGYIARSFSNYIKLFTCIVFSLIGIKSFAKIQMIKSTTQLMYRLAQSPYSVVVFYFKDKNALRDPARKAQLEALHIMMRSISKDPLYANADLQILLVDVARANLFSALGTFTIKKLPATLIFIGRQPVGEKLTGFIDRTQLTQAINSALGTLMQERMKQKEYQLKQEVEMAKIRSFDQAYMWGTYWAPYWNWGYAPFWEFGWRPYDRWYWGSL